MLLDQQAVGNFSGVGEGSAYRVGVAQIGGHAAPLFLIGRLYDDRIAQCLGCPDSRGLIGGEHVNRRGQAGSTQEVRGQQLVVRDPDAELGRLVGDRAVEPAGAGAGAEGVNVRDQPAEGNVHVEGRLQEMEHVGSACRMRPENGLEARHVQHIACMCGILRGRQDDVDRRHDPGKAGLSRRSHETWRRDGNVAPAVFDRYGRADPVNVRNRKVVVHLEGCHPPEHPVRQSGDRGGRRRRTIGRFVQGRGHQRIQGFEGIIRPDPDAKPAGHGGLPDAIQESRPDLPGRWDSYSGLIGLMRHRRVGSRRASDLVGCIITPCRTGYAVPSGRAG